MWDWTICFGRLCLIFLIHFINYFIYQVEEMKFVVPVEGNKTRIAYLWDATFDYRCQYRTNNDVYSFLEEFPVASAFDGDLVPIQCLLLCMNFKWNFNHPFRIQINRDFKKMMKITVDFTDTWNHWQEKVLQGHRHLFREISDGWYNILWLVIHHLYLYLFWFV